MARRTRKHERGQSLVEFAVVFPVFMFMLAGVIQFGLIFLGQNTLNQIVRDGGRFAATAQPCDGTQAGTIQTKMQSLGDGTVLAGKVVAAVPTWSATSCPSDATSDVWVKVSATATVPIFFPLVPGNGNLASAAEYRVEPVAPKS